MGSTPGAARQGAVSPEASASTPASREDSPLAVRGLAVGYGARSVIDGLDIDVHRGEFTAIIGPNACGKSTLLRALARLLTPTSGTVLLDGDDIRHRPTREVARRVGLLPQSAIAPDGITVFELVARGRFPHQNVLSAWSHTDEAAVAAALRATGVEPLAERPVDALSGGQRQRVWIAMVLAQETPTILLDEPTTFLDIGHQLEVLDLVAHMREEGRTIVAVLHDINQAARYATRLVAMCDGRIVAQGAPEDILTADLVAEVFGVRARIIADPDTGQPLVLPRSVVSGD